MLLLLALLFEPLVGVLLLELPNECSRWLHDGAIDGGHGLALVGRVRTTLFMRRPGNVSSIQQRESVTGVG